MRRPWLALGRDRRSIAAVELALVAPVLLTLTLGTYEVAEIFRASMLVAYAAQSIADMTAQQIGGVSDTTSGSLGNFCTAAKRVMNPFPTTGSSGNPGAFSAAIVSVTNDAGTVGIDWESDVACNVTAGSFANQALSYATQAIPNGTLPSCAQSGAPIDLIPCDGDSVILVQVSYHYNGAIHFVLPTLLGSLVLTQTAYARPRGNTTITCTEPSTGNPCP
jgi:Flp pilus assembly protein TadG